MLAPSSWLRLYGICGLAGAAVAVRRGERAHLLGIPFPGTVGVQAATIGTGLSAPVPVLFGVAWVGRRLGALVPARRAASVHPAPVLRAE